MAKRAALGTAFMEARRVTAAAPASTALPGKTLPGKTRRPKTQVKASIWIDPGLLDRARNAVDALSGPPERLTFTALLNRALEVEIGRLAKRHNQGRPFPNRRGELQRGTRRKV